jgi:hypothetical protein
VRAHEFARRVFARWDRRVVSPLPLGLVFLQRPARPRQQAAPAVSLRRDLHLHVRPQISLVLVRPAQTTAEAHYRAGDRTTLAGPLVLRARAAGRAERLVERLFARGTRVEVSTGPVASHLGQPPRGVPALASPPQLTVRRSEPAAGDERRDERHERLGKVENSVAAADARTPSCAAADPVVDVGRLTDQVVAAIDQRLVAQAERLGRS